MFFPNIFWGRYEEGGDDTGYRLQVESVSACVTNTLDLAHRFGKGLTRRFRKWVSPPSRRSIFDAERGAPVGVVTRAPAYRGRKAAAK